MQPVSCPDFAESGPIIQFALVRRFKERIVKPPAVRVSKSWLYHDDALKL